VREQVLATFLGSWNIREEAWLKSRLQVEEDVLRWWPHLKRDQAPPFLDERREARYRQARLYFAERLSGGDAVDSVRLAEEVTVLREVRIRDLLTLRIPFFGVVVDLNDLTLVSAVSFAAILGWLSFALYSEKQGLQFVFGRAREWGKLPLCYDLLVPRQVLSRPPHSDASFKHHLSWRPKVLFLLPAGVQIYVVIHHVDSYHAAVSINQAAAEAGLALTLTVSAAVLLLTWRCLWLSLQIDLEWEDRVREVIRLRGQETSQLELLDALD
jgi:hypothetical protein